MTNHSIQAFFPPTPATSSPGPTSSPTSRSGRQGDGFTADEVARTVARSDEPWQPTREYRDCEIRELQAGPHAVTFMGRVANLHDIPVVPKSPRAAQGCIKLCIKDGDSAITVRFWYASHVPAIRLGSLVSVWTCHVTDGRNGQLATQIAPLFTSLFPERDRHCHLMVHEHSDDSRMYTTPLGYQEGMLLSGLMTLRSFIDGGHDVADSKILVVVKSIGPKKSVTRTDGTKTDKVDMEVHDHTAEATLSLWGIASLSPFASSSPRPTSSPEACIARAGWTIGETTLLLQSPGCSVRQKAYLSLTSNTIVDVDPCIADAEWLQKWSLRRKKREAINPPCPERPFDIEVFKRRRVRCLFTLADLDDFARVAPNDTFQGYLSVVLVEMRLASCYKAHMLFCGECCNLAIFANANVASCKGCDRLIKLRLNPRIIGQVIDETGAVQAGKLLLSDQAWTDLLGADAEGLLQLSYDDLKARSEQLSFCRLTLLFSWNGDESIAGARICVWSVCN